ncbi:MAG: hypothetical protein PF689_07035, partial [Deltaproteobacteria bacterium]|nr:hypothetical protein [Deltaproteobacteria bacterium]
ELICFVVTSCNSINYVCEVTPRISIQLLNQSITPILGTGTCSHPKPKLLPNKFFDSNKKD